MEPIVNIVHELYAMIAFLIYLPVILADRLNEAAASIPLTYSMDFHVIPAFVTVLGLLVFWRPINKIRKVFTTIPMVGSFLWVLILYTAFSALFVLAHNAILTACFLMTVTVLYGRRYLITRDATLS